MRESLRLRIRWVQELTARAALALGQRLVERGVLTAPTAVSGLHLDELAELVESVGRWCSTCGTGSSRDRRSQRRSA